MAATEPICEQIAEALKALFADIDPVDDDTYWYKYRVERTNVLELRTVAQGVDNYGPIMLIGPGDQYMQEDSGEEVRHFMDIFVIAGKNNDSAVDDPFLREDSIDIPIPASTWTYQNRMLADMIRKLLSTADDGSNSIQLGGLCTNILLPDIRRDFAIPPRQALVLCRFQVEYDINKGTGA